VKPAHGSHEPLTRSFIVFIVMRRIMTGGCDN
jgi:hypothetical protein